MSTVNSRLLIKVWGSRTFTSATNILNPIYLNKTRKEKEKKLQTNKSIHFKNTKINRAITFIIWFWFRSIFKLLQYTIQLIGVRVVEQALPLRENVWTCPQNIVQRISIVVSKFGCKIITTVIWQEKNEEHLVHLHVYCRTVQYTVCTVLRAMPYMPCSVVHCSTE